VFVGGLDDKSPSEATAATLGLSPSAVVAGRLTSRETVALMERCDGFVGNDGAPTHLAALANLPVVAVYCNWEVPGLWEPIASPWSVALRPSWESRGADFGISDVPVSSVIEASTRMLMEPRRDADRQPHHIVTHKRDGRIASIMRRSALYSDS
jgi:ADP-heptose:LPS heptosyltransferase